LGGSAGDNFFDFKPGQFVTLDLPIDTRPTRRYRSYSIASWPDGSNVFELLIVLNKTGAGTQYIFNEVQVGTELKFRGPLGVFVLPEELNKDLILICTGTGIAPFRSMLHHICNLQIPHKNIYLYLAPVSKRFTLLRRDEGAAAYTQRFLFLPTLSRQQWKATRDMCMLFMRQYVKKNRMHSFISAAGRIWSMKPDKKFWIWVMIRRRYIWSCTGRNEITSST
jgi:NAD(P)H-flavin reductase